MKKGILGTIASLTLAVAGLQAQGGGFGVGVGTGRGGVGGIMVEQFQQAGTIGGVGSGRGFVMINGDSSRTVTGRPVSATEERNSKQTLADGTEIATSETHHFYRDGAGRTRVETAGGSTTIVDPVAKVTVTLSADTKTAHRMTMFVDAETIRPRPALSEPRATSTASTYIFTVGDGATTATVTTGGEIAGGGLLRARRGNAENMQHEDVGVESLNGVLATHTRDTLTIPQGQIGNNRDIHVVNERWYSDDLQMLVKTVNSDPRFGENTYELTNVTRGEPDPALFQIPPDYTVVDAPTIHNDRPAGRDQ